MAQPTNLRDMPDLTPNEATRQSDLRIAFLEADIVFWRNLADTARLGLSRCQPTEGRDSDHDPGELPPI